MKPNQIICGNNIEVVKSWPANCIDSIVTDPPYGLGFMGKEWDTFKEKELTKSTASSTWGLEGRRCSRATIAGSYDFSRNPEFQQWFTIWAKAMLRITKPGGFLLCFGGTRTYHRLTCAIEDAGWEIRDCMMWLYGSGFPKSHNISKAIDKAEGAERKKQWTSYTPDCKRGVIGPGETRPWLEKAQAEGGRWEQTDTPATDLAQLWSGYGTALKPAWEPIIVAMKPLDGTFAHNAEKHGVAGLNIDAGRISYQGETPNMGGRKNAKMGGEGYGFKIEGRPDKPNTQGRWPANLILDEEAGAMLDEQTGNTSQTGNRKNKKRVQKDKINTPFTRGKDAPEYTDSGRASRFFKKIEGPEPCFLCGYIEEHGNLEVGPGVFLCDECLLRGEALDLPKRFLYCAKTSRKERNMGMEDSSGKKVNDGRQTPIDNPYQRGETIRSNTHPTVKPLALMKYLCTLLKMPSADQIILDPFLGSGTTGMACKELGINFIGIEKEQEYCEISVKRIAAVQGQEITLHTETTLPVSKNVETFRATTDSAGGGRCPNKSLPHVSEHRQSIINAAAAELRQRRNGK